jgi:hypothetical protein
MRVNQRLKGTEDAGTGILGLCALICAVTVFAFYMRGKTKTTPAVFSSTQISSANALSYKHARTINIAPASGRPSTPSAPEITAGALGEVKRDTGKRVARRITVSSPTYRAYGIPY